MGLLNGLTVACEPAVVCRRLPVNSHFESISMRLRAVRLRFLFEQLLGFRRSHRFPALLADAASVNRNVGMPDHLHSAFGAGKSEGRHTKPKKIVGLFTIVDF
jgi:hypothetical protein